MKGTMRALAMATALLVGAGLAWAAHHKEGEGHGMTPAKIDKQDTRVGKVFTNPEGKTLYTFAKDPEGESACTGQCAQFWPPVTAPADAEPVGGFTVITRPDGTRQWAYQGKPLYTFAKDKEAGDVKGHRMTGFGGEWLAAGAGKDDRTG